MKLPRQGSYTRYVSPTYELYEKVRFYIFSYFYLGTKHEILQISNYKLLFILDLPNQRASVVLIGCSKIIQRHGNNENIFH